MDSSLLTGSKIGARSGDGGRSFRLLSRCIAQLESRTLFDDYRSTFDRTKKHLADNGVDIEKTQLTLGPWRQFDPDEEQFIGHTAADAMLTREYRKPFVVPTESEV